MHFAPEIETLFDYKHAGFQLVEALLLEPVDVSSPPGLHNPLAPSRRY